ncbi:hypothetical protein UK23_23030, partial [Lentzea aerocolonigenes]
EHDLSKEPLVFQRAVARTAQIPWMSATTTDLGWSTRRLSPSTRFMQWYARRLFEVIPRNRRVYRSFIRVSQMVDHPAALFRPAVLWPVLTRGGLSGSRPRAKER